MNSSAPDATTFSTDIAGLEECLPPRVVDLQDDDSFD